MSAVEKLTRKQKSDAKLESAKGAILALFAKDSREFIPSSEIHAKLGKVMSEGMFGRAKNALGISHRRVAGGNGAKARYEWRNPSYKSGRKSTRKS